MTSRSFEDAQKAWLQVERIPFGFVIAEEREALLEFVEEPLREAVGIMHDKNIPTVGSSCNANDYMEGRAWINTYYNFMTARNQKVVDRHSDVEKFTVRSHNIGKLVTVAGLFFPIGERDLPSDVGEQAVRLAEKFYQQPDFLPRNV